MAKTPQEIARDFSENGYVSGIELLSPSEASVFRDHVLQLLDAFGEERDVVRNVANYLSWGYDLASRPFLVDILEALIGPEILLLGSMLLIKPAGSASVVLWHADGEFQSHPGTNHVAAWLALNPSHRRNGCVKVVEGSHRQKHLHHEVVSPNNQIFKALTLVEEPDPEKVRYLELEPGQFSMHNQAIVHGSDANGSDTMRIGLILRYGTPEGSDLSEPFIQVRGNTDLRDAQLPPSRFEGTDEERIPALIAYNREIEAQLSVQ